MPNTTSQRKARYPHKIFTADGRAYRKVEIPPLAVSRVKVTKKTSAPRAKPLSTTARLMAMDRKELRGMLVRHSIHPDQAREAAERETEKTHKYFAKMLRDYNKKKKETKNKTMSLVEKADKKMTEAASVIPRVAGHEKSDFEKPGAQHLRHASGPLSQTGQTYYKEALDFIEQMSPEEKEQFWVLQERNKNATCYEELITKKDWKEMQKQKEASPEEKIEAPHEKEEEENTMEEEENKIEEEEKNVDVDAMEIDDDVQPHEQPEEVVNEEE